MQVEHHDGAVAVAATARDFSSPDGAATPRSWREFLGRLTVWAGVLALSTGLVCLVAANWDGMSKWERIGLAWLTLVASSLFAWWSHARDGRSLRTEGAVFLAGTVLGALLALIGQTYQTGADTWQLFAWWAVLLLPWVIGAPGTAVWLLWGLVANVSLWLWGDVAGFWGYYGVSRGMLLNAVVQGGFNLALLFAWEHAAPRAGIESHARIGPRLAALTALALVTMPTVFSSSSLLVESLLLWAAVVAILYFRYRRFRLDLAILALLCLSGIAVSLRLLIDLVADNIFRLNEGLLLLFALVLMGEAALAGKWLRRVAAESGPGGAASGGEPAQAIAPADVLAAAQQPDVSPAAPDPQALAAPAPAPQVASRDEPAKAAGAHPVAERTPWYMHALVAFGAWLATLLLILFLVLAQIVDGAASCLTVGLLLCAASAVLSRQNAGMFADQAAIAMGGAGLVLAGIGLFHDEQDGAWWSMALLSAALYAAARGSVLRVMAGMFVAVSVLVGVEQSFGLEGSLNQYRMLERLLDMSDGWRMLPLASVPMAWVAAWLFLQAEGRFRAVLLPLAWALAFVSQAAAWSSAGVTPLTFVNDWSDAPSYLLLALAAGLLPAVLAAGWLGRERFARIPPPLRLGMPAALAVLAIPLLPMPAVAFALAWMIAGHAMRMRELKFFGVAGGLFYLGIYYYQLHISLLDKGIWLCATGVLALLLWRFVLRGRTAGDEPRQAGAPASSPSRWQRLAVPAGLCLALAASGWSVAGFERLLANGRTVLLELAPVDPRGLMQGDYMALEFDIARRIDRYADDTPRDGYFVLAPDQDGVGRLVRAQRSVQDLADGEIPLRFRIRDREVRVVTNAYFFPEGQAQKYEKARYGELRVDGSGKALLVGMRDENRNPL